MKIILASKSPRRKELLTQIGFEFEIIVSDCDENIDIASPLELVKELSLRKAKAVEDNLTDEEYLVIGADTLVYCEGEIMGKPENKEDAFRMLSKLQGSEHYVYTGVTLIKREGGKVNIESFVEGTAVEFYPMSENEINSYIESGEPMDKAGAYAIQGLCAKYIRGIKGDYNNVVGLPIAKIYQVLNN